MLWHQRDKIKEIKIDDNKATPKFCCVSFLVSKSKLENNAIKLADEEKNKMNENECCYLQ